MTDSCHPALRGRFGTTNYYLVPMPVGEVVSKVRLPADVAGWENLTVNEKYQRKLNESRVRREIAPYFASEPDRFSGALVLASQGPIKFEPLSKVGGAAHSLPGMYSGPASDMGFVMLGKDAALVPLDGQHRARAFKLALEGYSDRASPEVRPNPALASDTVAVILVRFETGQSRRIFNKLNKYARPPVKSDKLITDDDDAVAFITRQLLDKMLPSRLVNPDNVLKDGSHRFTTMATLYEANKKLISVLPVPITVKPEKIGPAERDDRMRDLEKEWSRLISGLGPWSKALKDPGTRGDARRAELRRRYVVCRPIGQTALVNGYALACKKCGDRADRDDLVARLDRINWSMGAQHWRGLLVKNNGKISAGKPASNNAGVVIAHMIGVRLTREEREGVLEFVHGSAAGRHRLPKQVAPADL